MIVRCANRECGREFLNASLPLLCSCGHRTTDAGVERLVHKLPCVHRGDVIRRELCPSCRGKVELKIFSCAVHGECSIANGSSVRSCATCGDYAKHRGPKVLHCLYHVCPLKSNDLWAKNVRQLLKRVDVFTGERIAAIATGPGMHSPRTVKEAFRGSGFRFLELPNDKELREVATFIPLLSEVESTASDEAFFYAHTKGNSTTGNKTGAAYWRNAMYHHLLDRADECMKLLQSYKAVGTHKMIYGSPERAPYPNKLQHGTWMFAGTFFWARSDQVFSHPKWRDVPVNRYGAEAWLSGLFEPNDCYSIFQPWPENKYPTPNPYQPELYKNPIKDDDEICAS